MESKDLEIDIELDFVDKAKKYDIRAEKFELKGEKGGFDRICFIPEGITVFIEFKRTPNDNPSAHQIAFGKDMSKRGFPVLVTSSAQEALEFCLTYHTRLKYHG